MDLYDLGPVGWVESQSIYHALAELNREGLIICYPVEPYICLGLHDDLEQEIDESYCREKNIPLLRRETGGGVVYLDDRQIFFQLVVRRDNPLLPLRRQDYYEKFLEPALALYRGLGLQAELKAPADIVGGGRKYSGNGSGDIGFCTAYVGNILLDFDFSVMSRALKVPDETYRRHLYRALRENILTLTDCLPYPAEYSTLSRTLAAGFAKQWGELSLCLPDEELLAAARHAGKRLTSREWLGMPGRKTALRRVKIAEGLYLQTGESVGRECSAVLVRDGVVEEIAAQDNIRMAGNVSR